MLTTQVWSSWLQLLEESEHVKEDPAEHHNNGARIRRKQLRHPNSYAKAAKESKQLRKRVLCLVLCSDVKIAGIIAIGRSLMIHVAIGRSLMIYVAIGRSLMMVKR